MRNVALMTALLMSVTMPADAQTMFGAPGRCTAFRIGTLDLKPVCAGKIVNINYPDGRVGVWFSVAKGSVISFSGFDRKPTPDTGVMAVDQITRTSKDTPAATYAASGQCTYGNFHRGHRKVACRAMANGEIYTAAFEMSAAPR